MINLGITSQRLRFLVLNCFVFTLLGCDPQITQSDMTETAASDFTRAHNQRFADNLDLFSVIQSDKFIMSKISSKRLKSIFSYSNHFKNVNLIFRRVFK